MYKDIKKILDKHGITFYIQYGTAIGALRHNGLIPWDDDIDADTHPHVIWKGDDFEQSLMDRKAPFIDLFPIDPYPSTRPRQILANAMIWGNAGTIWAIDHIRSIRLHKLLCWMPDFFKKLELWSVNKDSDLTVVFSTGFAHCIFPSDYYGTPTMHVFEDTEAPLPHEIHKMLQ